VFRMRRWRTAWWVVPPSPHAGGELAPAIRYPPRFVRRADAQREAKEGYAESKANRRYCWSTTRVSIWETGNAEILATHVHACSSNERGEGEGRDPQGPFRLPAGESLIWRVTEARLVSVASLFSECWD